MIFKILVIKYKLIFIIKLLIIETTFIYIYITYLNIDDSLIIN